MELKNILHLKYLGVLQSGDDDPLVPVDNHTENCARQRRVEETKAIATLLTSTGTMQNKEERYEGNH